MKPDDSVVLLLWHATPFRADKFEDHWRPIAEAALDYGATSWAFLRSKDDPSDFIQMASWRSKLDFDRYWYGPEFEAFRTEYSSWYQVPIIYEWYERIERGALEAEAPAALDAE